MHWEREIRGSRGFTLVEILISFLVLGILVAIAVPDWSTFLLTFRLKGGARQVQADLDRGKWRAISENANHRLVFSSTSYTVEKKDGAGNWQDTGEGKDLPDDITVQTNTTIEYSVIGKKVGSGTTTVKLCNTKGEGRNLEVNSRGRIRVCEPSSCNGNC